MLSRIAESLFWIGRYIERADDTARILDIYLQQILEDASVEDEACRSLFEVMGRPMPEDGSPVGVREVLQQLAYDRQAASSITGALAAGRVNARSARDSVSSELWEALNLTYLDLSEQRRRAERMGPHRFFQWVRERTALASGVADSTMSRDEGWLFLDLGRSIERVDMTARLLTTRATGTSGPNWTTLLRACGANEAYLRTYRGRVSDRTAGEFLMLDRLFPRSLFFALSRAEDRIQELDRGGDGRVGTDDPARRQLGRARTGLEFLGVDEMMQDLQGNLEAVQTACADATSAVGTRYFPHAVIEWVGKGA
ncbi:alpha-E domain-containing protein [Jatrophihabitans telluris]|uniref:Alpha-E domain-containing protein n=1 Tax=Jatrophihabitans telluris TaxID=2038343 RepID=A0ABY4R175_9ACTN|nr:alpha-E domain-containing protein [Jatrophihabitans telluris]UQX89227.1 alpha-E domain-containing protein [Jatrophihabitans telluris]